MQKAKREVLGFGFAIIVAVISFNAAADEKSSEDSNRGGLILSITADGAQFGGEYYGTNYEAQITFDSSWTDSAGSSPGVKGTGDTGVTSRLGYRIKGTGSEHLTFGIHYHQNFGGQDENGATKEQIIGPYVGFQRIFPGTNFSIFAFILPISHQVTEAFDSPGGNNIKTATYKYFQDGGIGLAYLF